MTLIHRADIYAIIVASALFGAWYGVTERIKQAETIDNWLEIKSIFVPDFVEGDEKSAIVVVDIDRKRPVTYDWILVAKPILENQKFYCFNHGSRNITPKDNPLTGLTIKRVFGDRGCQWQPGRFKLRLSGAVKREGYQDAYASWESNVFEVLPRGSSTYVSPEQNMILNEIDPTTLGPPITEP